MLNKISLLYLLFSSSTILLGNNAFIDNNAKISQNPATEVPVNLSAKEKGSNIQLRPKFIVTSVKNGTSIPIKEATGSSVFMLRIGESYKIKAEMEGYLTKESIQNINNAPDREGLNIIFDLEPEPTASLVLKVIDEISGDEIDATFKISSADYVNNGKTSRANPAYRTVLKKSGIYQIEATSNDHKLKKESLPIEIGIPIKNYTKEIKLERLGGEVRILVVSNQTGQLLKGVNLMIMNTSENALFFNSLLPEGEAMMELASNKNYMATVVLAGYTSTQVELNRMKQNEYTIKMSSENFVTFGAFDKYTGQRLAADFKISLAGNEQQIKGSTENNIKYYPTKKGIYQLEISHPNYLTKTETLNLENISAGKSEFKINLESAFDDYVILVVDAQDKQIIQGTELKIFDEKQQVVAVNLNEKTGEHKVVLEKNKNYTFELKANGYKAQKGTLQKGTSKLITIGLQKQDESFVFSAIDAITKKAIEAKFKFSRTGDSSIEGISGQDKNYTAALKPDEVYNVEVTADGYKSFKENILSSNIKDGKKIIELQRTIYPFQFKIVENQQKQAVANTKINLTNLSTGQTHAIVTDNSGFKSALSIESSYSISIQADGFEDFKTMINPKELAINNKFEQELELQKKKINRYIITVIDEETKNPIKTAQLAIFNDNKENLLGLNRNSTEDWSADLNIDLQYNVEAKSSGYATFTGLLPKPTSGSQIQVKLKKIPTREITFVAVDAISKTPVASTFILMQDTENVSGKMIQEETKAIVTLETDKKYTIEIASTYYKTVKGSVNLEKAVNNTLTFDLVKESYLCNFSIIDAKTKEPLAGSQLKITDTNNKPVTIVYNQQTKSFQANLTANQVYKIESEAPEYHAITDNFNTNTFTYNSVFKREIGLVKKEIPKPVVIQDVAKEEAKPAPKSAVITEETKKTIEQNESKVEKGNNNQPDRMTIGVEITDIEKQRKEITIAEESKKTAPTPPIEKEKKPIVVSTPAKAIEKVLPPPIKNTEFPKVLAVGNKVTLVNLYFEQSTPNLKPTSFPELDKLASIMKNNPKLKIDIIGHTDNQGDERLNISLSYYRAKVVANYLFNKGIEETRMQAIGKGSKEPIAPNDSEEHMAENRRVEFVVVEN